MTEDEKRRMEREAREERPEEQDETVEDLDVPEDKSQDVRGGGNTKYGNIEL